MNHDDHSIWTTRPSFDTAAAPMTRRARSGTLPSRLPSRLDTSAVPTNHLGSLALISPDGNDIVYDVAPPATRQAAVGQPTQTGLPTGGRYTPSLDRKRSPPLASIPEPASPLPGAETKTTPMSVIPVAVLETPQKSLLSSGSGIDSSGSSATSSLLSPPTRGSGRTRSGSLNSLASYPFGPSIWSPKNPPPHHGPVTAMPLQSTGTPLEKHDPMGLFSNELNKTANPTRIRSYTLDGGVDWASPQPPPALQYSQRSRTQTLMGGPAAAQVMLNRFGKQHQLMSDTTAGDGAAIQLVELSNVPTPALWVSNVPPQATPYTLHSLFGSFGRVESARLVAQRRCAYILFASTVQAIEAQATANGAELYVGNGPSAVAFAQIVPNHSSWSAPTASEVAEAGQDLASTIKMYSNSGPVSLSSTRQGSPEFIHHATTQQQQQTPAHKQAHPHSHHHSHLPHHQNLTSHSLHHNVHHHTAVAAPSVGSIAAAPISVAYILQTLNAGPEEVTEGVAHLRRAASVDFDMPIRPLSELLAEDIAGKGRSDSEGPHAERTYNAAVLRDLRRKLESMTAADVEELALDMQRELPVLASDYIGNTVVQFVFEGSNSDIRDMMLRRLTDVFATTGTHKNGTWAVQKMIDSAKGPRQFAQVERVIRPHLVALLLDQFGNYVVQGCLKFGAPYNDFVFSGIASSLAKVSPNRFGARAIRAVLESEHTTAANQRLVATAIVQQIAMLATNPNGCLLVSWLLDSFERSDPEMHSRTHAVVAAQLIPQHLVAICTSKLGVGIVLKLAASHSSSSHRLFDALLEPLTDRPPASLIQVLSDPTGHGATCIFRLLTTVFPPNSLERQVTVNKLRMIMLRSGAHVPNHKRLLEEVGLEMLHQDVSAGGSEHALESSPDESPEH